MCRCKQCGLTGTYRFIELDNNGICKYCRSFQQKTFRGADRIVKDLNLADGEKVGVTVSGGKDSIYMWGVLTELLGPDHVTAFCFYRPGITIEVAMDNVRKTQKILGTDLVIHEDARAYERFRRNLEILLDDPRPEMVRVLLCAGCRYGITKSLYEEGEKKNIHKFFSGASYLELAPFKEELIAACSATGDLDDGFSCLLKDYPAIDYDDNLAIIERDHHMKYKNNDTAERQINAGSEIQLFDFDEYFENKPDSIEEIVKEKYGWRKTNRSWHFDCGIEDLKDIFYYGLLGYTEMDFRMAAMVRYGLVEREEAIAVVESEYEKSAGSYYKALELLRKHRLDHKKAQLDKLFKESPYLTSPADFHDLKGGTIHMIGIGGASMCGIAVLLKERGFTVTGSDRLDGESMQMLREKGIRATAGHSADNVEGADLVVYSMAVPDDHIELQAARKKRIPIIERSVLLGQLSCEYKTSIAVCGTHGKTTVTSMLTQILVDTGMDPTVHIGGVLDSIGGSVRSGGSDIFLTEACEYRQNFMNVRATDALLLDIDTDHLDYYRDIEEIESSFGDFMKKLPATGWALGNGDDERVVRQLHTLACSTETFGTKENCDYRMINISEDESGYVDFEMLYQNEKLCSVHTGVPGMFNAYNALAALAAAHHLKADMQEAAKIIGDFRGAHRRFEKTGELCGAELFHDYGHNPKEMENAIHIARKRCKRGRLWAVIQPHTFSRVKTMFDQYLLCAKEADKVLVTDIFAARETDPGDINSRMLVDGMREKGIDAYLTPTFEDTADVLKVQLQEDDLVITLGCGNIYMLNEMLKPDDEN